MDHAHGQIVAGRSLAGEGSSFSAVDPRDGSTLPGTFFDATEDHVDQALTAASQAHARWRRAPREQRALLLESIATGLEDLGDALVTRASAETGLPAARIVGERGRTAGQLRLFAAVAREGAYLDARIDPALPDRTPLPRPDLRRMLVPLGPVAVFGASNFPLAFSVAGGDTAAALAAGCPVVAKAHPAHPGTSQLVAETITEAIARVDAPPGLFSCVHGQGHAVGRHLVEHPMTKAVGFTGSLAGGRALHALAAQRPEPIPLFAEMGSINPVVLLPGAVGRDPKALADALFGSLTLGVGQFCTNPGLLLVLAGSSTETFIDRLRARADEAPAATMLHAGIATGYETGHRALADTGATRLTQPPTPRSGHASVHPVVWRSSAADIAREPTLRQECFGPSTVVAVAETLEELTAAVRSLDGQLTATLHAGDDDHDRVDALLPLLEERAGRVLFGGVPTGVEVAPAMHHGGPWPATTDARFTSVGTAAISRFLRPVCWQDAPAALLPPELRDGNPTGIPRMVDGRLQRPES